MNAPKITSIIPLTVPHEVIHLSLYTVDGVEEFEQHASAVLGMAMVDRDPSDGQIEYLVHEPDWRCPVTLAEFDETLSNRYIVGVYPTGVEPEECDVNEAREALRNQVKAHREAIQRRLKSESDAAFAQLLSPPA